MYHVWHNQDCNYNHVHHLYQTIRLPWKQILCLRFVITIKVIKLVRLQYIFICFSNCWVISVVLSNRVRINNEIFDNRQNLFTWNFFCITNSISSHTTALIWNVKNSRSNWVRLNKLSSMYLDFEWKRCRRHQTRHCHRQIDWELWMWTGHELKFKFHHQIRKAAILMPDLLTWAPHTAIKRIQEHLNGPQHRI